MENIKFIEMTSEVLPEMLDIYNYYVLTTTATFHSASLTLGQMREILFFDNPRFKSFAILCDRVVCGYAIAAQFKNREAYDSTAEVTVYLKPEYTGKGIGNRAVQFVEDYALTQDFHVLLALVCSENTQSISVFEKNGYEKCAHYKEIGKKFGRWLNLDVYQKIID
jgi:phosphinothricin acetyltransferase